ncbi:hypothetical protein ACROYT_G000910 [Oculina patagonica]
MFNLGNAQAAEVDHCVVSVKGHFTMFQTGGKIVDIDQEQERAEDASLRNADLDRSQRRLGISNHKVPFTLPDENLDANSDLTDHPFATSQSSRTLERCDDKNVRLLFVCYQRFKGLLGKSYHTKKSVFDKIGEEFNLQSDLVVTGDQCLRKWKKWKLSKKKPRTTTSKRVDQCIGGNASVRQVFTFNTGSPFPCLRLI